MRCAPRPVASAAKKTREPSAGARAVPPMPPPSFEEGGGGLPACQYSHCIAAAASCLNEQLGHCAQSLSHHTIEILTPLVHHAPAIVEVCVRAPSSDAVSDARAWTHGHTSARLRMLCADAGAGTHAGCRLTHLLYQFMSSPAISSCIVSSRQRLARLRSAPLSAPLPPLRSSRPAPLL